MKPSSEKQIIRHEDRPFNRPREKDSRTRLLTLVTKLELGGAQQVALNTLRLLPKENYRLYLIAGEGGLLDEEALELEEVEVKLWRHFKHPIQPLADLWTLLRLVVFLRTRKIQCLHTHSSKAGFLGRLAGRLAGVPVVVHTVHGWPFHEYQSKLARAFYIILERMASRWTSRLVAVSQATVRKGLEHGIGRPDQYTVIFPGSDLSEFTPGRDDDRRMLRALLGIPSQAPVVGMVACLKPQKAPVIFVQAAKLVHHQFPAAHFLLVGDGQERPAVEAEIRRLDMQNRVHLLGWSWDVAGILKGLDIFALSSLWEGLPCVFAQAQACGLPVAATDVEGAREAVEAGVTGLLAAPNNPQALAKDLAELLASPGRRTAMGMAGQEFAKKFGLEPMVMRINALYKELLNLS